VRYLVGVIDDHGSATTPSITFPSAPPGIQIFAAALVVDPTHRTLGSVSAPITITTQ
jgi:hypothetical protein